MNIENIISQSDIANEDYIIVGVSSGPDSMALLNIIQKSTQKPIVCVHVNHNVRKESIEEAEYLKKYCKKFNIIFEYYEIKNYTGKNFENEAREKRYAFYEQILKKYHSHTLFLAHHGDDLIETTLMKIVRGSNIEGYAGIKQYTIQKDYIIIRPLISYTKEDILKYNKENNIKYFVDYTNEDTKYTRNRYRHNILPLLKKEDANIHLKFLKYSKELQEYYNYVEDITKEKINNDYKNNKIDISLFNKEHPFIKKQIVFHILSNIYNNNSNIIKEKHLEDIIKLANSSKSNTIINLPKNYIAKKTYKYITIEKNDVETTKKDYKILLKDYQEIADITIKKRDSWDTDGNDVCRLNTKNISMPIYIRNRKKGDKISLYGTNGTKKVKDIFIEKKMPQEKRDTYPLIVDNSDNILWIPNIKKSKYNVKKNEFYDIILTSNKEREENNEKEDK